MLLFIELFLATLLGFFSYGAAVRAVRRLQTTEDNLQTADVLGDVGSVSDAPSDSERGIAGNEPNAAVSGSGETAPDTNRPDADSIAEAPAVRKAPRFHSWLVSGDFQNYMLSAVVMVFAAYMAHSLVKPMGFTDYYSILLNVGILVFLATGLALSIVDIVTKILPSKMIYLGGGTSLALLVAAALTAGNWQLLLQMSIGGTLFFLFFGLIWYWQPNAFGFGDVRLSFLIGAALSFLSVESAFVAFVAMWILPLLAICVAAIFGKVTRNTQIAFGPWMIVGSVVGIFWGSQIMRLLI